MTRHRGPPRLNEPCACARRSTCGLVCCPEVRVCCVLTFCTAFFTTLLVLSSRDSLDAITACLSSRQYSDVPWSLMPSISSPRKRALSRPRRRSHKLVVLIVPLVGQNMVDIGGCLVGRPRRRSHKLIVLMVPLSGQNRVEMRGALKEHEEQHASGPLHVRTRTRTKCMAGSLCSND